MRNIINGIGKGIVIFSIAICLTIIFGATNAKAGVVDTGIIDISGKSLNWDEWEWTTNDINGVVCLLKYKGPAKSELIIPATSVSPSGKYVCNIMLCTTSGTIFGDAAPIDNLTIEDGVYLDRYCTGVFKNLKCKKLKVGQMNLFRTNSLGSLFADVTADEIDISNFDTSGIKIMGNMFSGCKVDKINVSNMKNPTCINMRGMFNYSTVKSINLSGFDTSNVTDMSNMFSGCKNLEFIDLKSFNTSNVTSMSYMFSSCKNLKSLDLNKFNTSNVTDMSYMFSNCESLKSLDLKSFNTSKLTNMSGMFSRCYSLESLDLKTFDVSQVTVMGYLFNADYSLKSIDISNWKANNVTAMTELFYTTKKNGSKIENESSLETIKMGAFEAKKCTKFNYMFYENTNLKNLSFTSFDASSGENFYGMFKRCKKLEDIDLTKIKINKATITGEMFSSCNELRKADISKWNLSNLTNTIYMFDECSALTNVNLGEQTTPYLTDMKNMFSLCKSLTSVDFSKFKADNLTSISYLFYACSNLEKIDLSGLNTSKVTSVQYAFDGKMRVLDLRDLDFSSVVENTSLNRKNSNIKVVYGPKKTGSGKIKISEYTDQNKNCYYYICKDITKNGKVKHVFYERTNAFPTNSNASATFIQEDNIKNKDFETIKEAETEDSQNDYHVWADEIEETAPTCINGHGHKATCLLCGVKQIGYYEGGIPNPNAHEYVTKVIEPTYDTEGYTEHKCALCGNSYTSNVKAKITKKDSTSPKNNSTSDGKKPTTVTTNKETAKTPAVPSLKSVKVAKKIATVKYKTVPGVSGYEVQYSTKKTFKSSKKLTVKGAKKSSVKITKLKSKKTYYVRVRAYTTSNGKKIYSKWSKVNTVIVK